MFQAVRDHAITRSAFAGIAVFAIVLVGALAVDSAALAADESAVTVTARDQDADALNAPFPDLAVTVSQTTNLVSQAITVSWEGGVRSTLPSSQGGGENYLQVMQCWGDDENGGPDRTTCQFGAANTPSATRTQSNVEIAPEDAQYSHESSSVFDPSLTGIPFRSVTGKLLRAVDDAGNIIPPRIKDTASADPNATIPNPAYSDLNNNEFFTKYTTNEVPWAGSGSDGRGSITFEVQTVLASYGLGCGEVTDATSTPRSCWLVVVPRGEGLNVESGLAWEQWKHRLAVRLDFQPVGSRCAIGSPERQLAGSELASDAVSSWQPSLCGTETGSAYTLLTTTDADAAAQANTAAEAPLALTSQAIDTGDGATDNLTYAPISLSGVSVTFAIDRNPLTTASPEAQARKGLPFEAMKLTPRLLAKLLTSSYLDALPTEADRSHIGSNPRNLLKDPDFLAINDPEWADQAIVGAVADIMVPQGRSAYMRAIWNYVLADADAAAFLAGKADPWGMTVNKWANTTDANASGTPLSLPRDDAPKVDPTEAFEGQPRALNSVTWRPYTNDLAAGAYYTLRGDGLTLSGWDEITVPNRWTRAPRSLVGERSVIALTDSSAAARYETVTAALLNPAGEYVTATTESLTAAAAAMVRSEVQPQVWGFSPTSDQAKNAKSAYPLAIPVYAATNAALGAPALRASYADFIRYAVTDGQNPGVEPGLLPEGYAPLPQGWRDQALVAANTIEYGETVTPSPTPQAPSNPAPAANTSSSTSTTTATAPVPAPASTDPGASGNVAGALAGAATPDDPDLAGLQSAVPLAIVAGLIAACLFPAIGRLRRRD